jgi:phosphonatase-like hydrolase
MTVAHSEFDAQAPDVEDNTMIELVVFDMAGTTVHDGDAVNASFRAALHVVGIDADPAVVNTVMGLPKPQAIRILLTHSGHSTSDAEINAIHDDFVERMSMYYRTAPSIHEIPGAAPVFAVLRQAGIKVALTTGFSKAVAEVLLARLDWSVPEVIDAYLASDEVARGRPYPDMIQLLMTRFGVRESRRVAKVGDTKADLEEGANAGCGLNIGVLTGSFTRVQLQACPHTHILKSVAEVPGVLREAGVVLQ